MFPKKLTLGKNERLKSRKLIERLFKEGKAITIFPLRASYLFLENDHPPLQTGFSVSSRNFKRAVDRNRIKRLMKEAFRLQKHDLEKVLIQKNKRMIVFLLYTGKELPDYKIMCDKSTLILQRLISIADETPVENT